MSSIASACRNAREGEQVVIIGAGFTGLAAAYELGRRGIKATILESDGLIGEDELRALRRSAFLLNPARGPIVREEALLQALRRGWIAGAALDTHFAYQLPPDHPLRRFPNVILTPHVSGADKSRLFPRRIGELLVWGNAVAGVASALLAVAGADGAVRLFPGLVRIPDVSFIGKSCPARLSRRTASRILSPTLPWKSSAPATGLAK